MDTELRRSQVETHQRALRAEAAAERFARGRQDRMTAPVSTVHLSQRGDALRHALATMTTVRLVGAGQTDRPRHGSRP
ncbi:MAG TPA: hypothetical protein VFO73_10515 [Candidatus Limnocylindrales bacterium]|nr:hypothetical protein [Candidatus Limnocylindrales bacterium]